MMVESNEASNSNKSPILAINHQALFRIAYIQHTSASKKETRLIKTETGITPIRYSQRGKPEHRTV